MINYMITSADIGKHLTIKKQLLNQLRIERNFLILLKNIYPKTKTNIVVNNETLKVFSLRTGTRQKYSVLTLFFNTILEALDNSIKPENKVKDGQMGRKK